MCRFLGLVAVSLAATVHADLNFLAVGDWGGASDGNPTTPAQLADANGMNSVAKALNAQFALLLGDNFYMAGIHGSENSRRFQETFENAYNGSSLQVPFYSIAGNHDHLGNVTAELAYSNHSKRWRYPSSWYSVTFPVDKNRTLQLIMIDTVVLFGNSDDAVTDQDPFPQPPGPADKALAAKQMAWLGAEMRESKADFLVVGGHYPVWSACRHGPTLKMRLFIKPMLERYHAHYLAGHDHCQGHIDEGKGPHYIVAGAGKECCYSPSHVASNPKNSIKFWMGGSKGSGYQKMPFDILSGFSSVRVNGDGMVAVLHAHNGTELYRTSTIPPRKPRAP